MRLGALDATGAIREAPAAASALSPAKIRPFPRLPLLLLLLLPLLFATPSPFRSS